MRRLLAVVATLVCLLAPVSAAAYNPLGDACHANQQASDSTACGTGTNDPISGPNGALKRVSLIIAIVAGIAAVIIIIISGFQYVLSGGDAQKTASARSALIGATVGLVIIVASESILLFVVSKL